MCSNAVSKRIRLVANSIERSSLTDLNSVTDAAALAMLRPRFEKSGMCNSSHAAGKPSTDSRRRASALLRPALRLDQASLHRVSIVLSASTAGCNATTSISRAIRFGTNTSSSYSAFTLSTKGWPAWARATWYSTSRRRRSATRVEPSTNLRTCKSTRAINCLSAVDDSISPSCAATSKA